MQHEVRQLVRFLVTGIRRATAAIVVAIFWTLPAFALTDSEHAEAAIDEGDARIEAELLVDARVATAGSTLRVGVLLRMDPGWHVYWKNSGDSGFATEIDWSSPDATFGPLRFPAPEVFLESGGLATTYGYADEVLIFSEAVVSADASGTLLLRAEARFLVCEIRCIPGQIQLETTLPVTRVSGIAGRTESRAAAIFDRFASRVPVLPEAVGIIVETTYSVDTVRAGDVFELVIRVAPCVSDSTRCPTTVQFAAAPGEFAIDVAESLDLDRVGTLTPPDGGPGALLVLRGRLLQGQLAPNEIEGVLALLIDGRPAAIAVSFPLPGMRADADVEPIGVTGSGSAPPSQDLSSPGLLAALGLGLLGGLILNLMPCVLPVLALKAFRIVEAGGDDPAALRRQGAAFLFGVLLSMAALAAVVLALRAAGEAVGWGFQFQRPGFLAFMGALLTVFALNLFGVYEISFTPRALGAVGNRSGATLRSFFDGGLAVLLATPCSAPFLGTAVGFAFAGSAISVITIFLAIGFGLAMPFLAMSFVPGLASRLPRPGAWMADLQTLLGFALLATVVWLLWIAGRSTGVEGVVWLLAFLLALGLLAWVFGKLQRAATQGAATRRAAMQRSARIAGAAWVVFAIAGFAWLPLDPANSTASHRQGEIRAWNAEEVQRVVDAGQSVFVDFTADWCLSCKLNERMVLSTDEVRALMDRLAVVRFRGDWTLRDEAIFAELQSHGRAGVPLYLVYRAGSRDDPEILPEILTVDRVTTALHRANGAESH